MAIFKGWFHLWYLVGWLFHQRVRLPSWACIRQRMDKSILCQIKRRTEWSQRPFRDNYKLVNGDRYSFRWDHRPCYWWTQQKNYPLVHWLLPLPMPRPLLHDRSDWWLQKTETTVIPKFHGYVVWHFYPISCHTKSGVEKVNCTYQRDHERSQLSNASFGCACSHRSWYYHQ